MEVTSPQPIKFMGKEDNAIGYIERNGEIYTLPVTKKTYNEMMTEVAKNKGVGINLTVKEQISSGAELVSAQVKPEPEVIPQVPLVEAMSKVQISVSTSQENAIKEIDKILKNRKPEEVVAMLKNEIKNGRDKIVDLVAQATSPARADRPSIYQF
jgi:O-phosphoseryl-tRNA(Cys) synthetase